MRETGKFCKIYCHEKQRGWAELIPFIDRWLNTTIGGSNGYTPVELMFGDPMSDMFEGILCKSPDEVPADKRLEDKLLRVYAKMKKKAIERQGKGKLGLSKWEPKLHGKVLVKYRPISAAVQGVTAKYVPPYGGPYIITQIIPPSTFKLSSSDRKI
jgi:hypothetical protein